MVLGDPCEPNGVATHRLKTTELLYHRDTYTAMFIAIVFMIAQNGDSPVCTQSSEEWIKKIYTWDSI